MGNIQKVVFGVFCILATLLIMGYLFYSAKKEKRLLKCTKKKKRLLVNMFSHILISCVLMIAEYLILQRFGFEIRYIIAIVCLSLVITTIIGSLLKKL